MLGQASNIERMMREYPIWVESYYNSIAGLEMARLIEQRNPGIAYEHFAVLFMEEAIAEMEGA